MTQTLKIGSHQIGDGHPVFIIAEAGSNHNGSLDEAKRLIDVAAEAKADAVKFQLFRADRLYPPNVGMVDTPAGKIDFFEFLEQAAMPPDWLAPLRAHAEERALVFLVSAFDEPMAEVLHEHAIAAHKVASPELNHIPLIRAMARHGVPLLISTGMGTLADMEAALAAARREGCDDVAFFQCVSCYPTEPADANLRVIPTLKQAFGVPVGWSDHTTHPLAAPRLATALGANLIEKHYTRDRSQDGPDHPFAIEPNELAEMVAMVRQLSAASDAERGALLDQHANAPYLGSPIKRVTEAEAELAACDRRSLFVIADMAAGDAITSDNVRVLRAERNLAPGIDPCFWDIAEGRHVVRDVPLGRGLVWDDLLR